MPVDLASNTKLMGLAGKYKLDCIFVKAYLGDPRDPNGSYRFAPHFGRTLARLQEAALDQLSDHAPLTLDLPWEAPAIRKDSSGGAAEAAAEDLLSGKGALTMRLLLALGLAGAALAQEVTLRAGLSRVDITPSSFGPMYGYANRKCGPATGVHDPLFAKVLVLEAGADKRPTPTSPTRSSTVTPTAPAAAGPATFPTCGPPPTAATAPT